MPSLTYDKFEMPKGIKVDEKTFTSTYGKFIAEPFERGFGHTIGNSLRRLLLTSIESPAIISFFMEGVPHEYMAVEGVTEDVTNIILNLKGALLRRLPLDDEGSAIRQQQVISTTLEVTQADLAEKGQKVITLGDLIKDCPYEVINPDLPIFTVTKPMTRRVELKVAIGRGYVPSEKHEVANRLVDEILIDSAYSPITLVNYFVEATRVGQATDFDRLILEVHTDGRITPKEAVAFAAKIFVKHLDVFENMADHEISFEESSKTIDSDRDELMQKLALGINEIELSVRSTNCLNGASIETIGELVVMPEPKLLQFRNFGKKSLNEIKAKLTEMGLGLGMDLSRFGITQENVKDKITTFLEENQTGGAAL
ncbi:MAG: DNA-directed RNA polymerase subunit alpha [Chlamydiales bacterium]|nr:DNA-directed RNA polymerase subunit alpha [Chlamydiales bacterium]MCH9619791.1 DNA-directed RNA polymerase subunit alpha [Chlamydiales bacterium]MCH9623397.1 DNA-directed RNA polymerase subunit alpha [Chlamydiales bacterium]